ncbi:MAG: radical SAM protein [Pyrinomonadaceae bacterium]|nr:radical SAM protein [Pyrinomonadaceae bacterium]
MNPKSTSPKFDEIAAKVIRGQRDDSPDDIALFPIHDFSAKLRQEDVLPRVKAYIDWQRGVRSGALDPKTSLPDFAPVSINLDITTACNFACDHCVDKDILNTPDRYHQQSLLDSIEVMTEKGLKSVIVIGGGEPTLYRYFTETVEFMKSLGLQVAIVSNGTRNSKIEEIAPYLDPTDWVRLSLDSGSEEVFQAMHKPRKKITLDEICEGIPKVKAVNPDFKIGFSFIITWRDAFINETNIVENLDEMVEATKRAKEYGFDYIAFKPFLTRAEENNAEIVDLKQSERHFEGIKSKIAVLLEEARELEDDSFQVYATTNLKVLLKGVSERYMSQPHECHMQYFRQVLSPLGLYNCPVYRNQPHGRLGDLDAYGTKDDFGKTLETTAAKIQSFDSTHQCREVTCLYHTVNWWIEDMIESPEKLKDLVPPVDFDPDYFL